MESRGLQQWTRLGTLSLAVGRGSCQAPISTRKSGLRRSVALPGSGQGVRRTGEGWKPARSSFGDPSLFLRSSFAGRSGRVPGSFAGDSGSRRKVFTGRASRSGSRGLWAGGTPGPAFCGMLCRWPGWNCGMVVGKEFMPLPPPVVARPVHNSIVCVCVCVGGVPTHTRTSSFAHGFHGCLDSSVVI